MTRSVWPQLLHFRKWSNGSQDQRVFFMVPFLHRLQRCLVLICSASLRAAWRGALPPCPFVRSFPTWLAWLVCSSARRVSGGGVPLAFCCLCMIRTSSFRLEMLRPEPGHAPPWRCCGQNPPTRCPGDAADRAGRNAPKSGHALPWRCCGPRRPERAQVRPRAAALVNLGDRITRIYQCPSCA